MYRGRGDTLWPGTPKIHQSAACALGSDRHGTGCPGAWDRRDDDALCHGSGADFLFLPRTADMRREDDKRID